MTSNEHGWKLTLTQGDRSIEYRWSEQFYRGESMGYLAELYDASTGEHFANHSEKDDALAGRVIVAATVFRRSELRGEIGYSSDWTVVRSAIELKNAVEALFDRSMTGEYLGQRSGNSYLFVQDVAEILGVDQPLVLHAAQQLERQSKLSLEGMVLVEYRPDEDDEIEEL